jgi:hypothetical protein
MFIVFFTYVLIAKKLKLLQTILILAVLLRLLFASDVLPFGISAIQNSSASTLAWRSWVGIIPCS